MTAIESAELALKRFNYEGLNPASAADAQAILAIIAGAICAAVEEAARLPVPGGLREDLLEWVRNPATHDECETPPRARAMIAGLLGHIDHLTRVLRDCGEDGTLAVWSDSYRAAFTAGAEAEKVAFIGIVREVLGGTQSADLLIDRLLATSPETLSTQG